jgi:hypothetical protein
MGYVAEGLHLVLVIIGLRYYFFENYIIMENKFDIFVICLFYAAINYVVPLILIMIIFAFLPMFFLA